MKYLKDAPVQKTKNLLAHPTAFGSVLHKGRKGQSREHPRREGLRLY